MYVGVGPEKAPRHRLSFQKWITDVHFPTGERGEERGRHAARRAGRFL